MPLDRRHVTIASRVMIPAYPLFAAGVGLSFVTLPQDRIDAGPALRFADNLVPLHAWGVGFLIVAGLLLGAMALHNRRAYAFALAVMTVWMFAWSALIFASAWGEASSWSAWTWPAFVGVACWASMLSLLAGES